MERQPYNWFERNVLGLGSEAHRQVYYITRHYPLGTWHTLFAGFCAGNMPWLIWLIFFSGLLNAQS